MQVQGPIPTDQPEDRFLRCEEALEPGFQALVRKAIEAGWNETEACAAIACLADHHMLAGECNERTDASIRKPNG